LAYRWGGPKRLPDARSAHRHQRPIAGMPEPLGYNTETTFGSYDFPNLTILRPKTWKIRLSVGGIWRCCGCSRIVS
jgi:hypothetical protein